MTTFNQAEANNRLATIIEMIDRALLCDPMLVTTERLLRNITAIAQGADEVILNEPSPPALDHIIASCDASIKENPGGPSAVGIVILMPQQPNPIQISQASPAKTNNQAEYDAVYIALTTLFDRHNNPQCNVEIRSDSQLVIKQLNKEIECHDKDLQRRRDRILELVTALPVPVIFVWRPRNSTPELKLANYLAQDYLGVPRH